MTVVPFGSYLIQVDASTADVLETKDILQSATGHGCIFRPNPVASSGDTSLRDDFDRSNANLDLDEVDKREDCRAGR